MINYQVELPYRVDPQRQGKQRATGIRARAALANGELVSVDIAELDRYSLQRVLRDHGDDHLVAKSVASLLLEHANTLPDAK